MEGNTAKLRFKGGARGGGWRQAAALLLGVLALAAWVDTAQALSKMQLMHTWGPVSFVFDSDAQRKQMEANGTYKQGNAAPFDVDIDPRSSRVFVALPWMMTGAAVTLATVENTQQVYSPRLVPYPDWSWHAGARGCDGLTSVFRVHVDRCGRLWVIDSGVADITNTFEHRCPPQLFVFTLRTNKLLVRHRFQTPEASCSEALLLNVVVEQVGVRCDKDAYAYVADAGGNALFVYSLRQDRSWRVANYLFYPDVNARLFHVAGSTMNLMDGLLGLAVAPTSNKQCGSYLFFHALTSFQEGRVCTSILRNASLFQGGENNAEEAFEFIGRREGQAGAQSSTATGIIFFSPVNKYSINCWFHRKTYNSPNLPAVEQDSEVIRFVTGMKVVPGGVNGGPEELWTISNNAQLLFTGGFKPNVNNTVNILRGNLRTLLAGVNC